MASTHTIKRGVQRTYSSVKKKNVRPTDTYDFEELTKCDSDTNPQMTTTNNWSRETFKCEFTGTKRKGSESPLKVARVNRAKKRAVDVGSQKEMEDVYHFTAIDDELCIAGSNSCPPSLTSSSDNKPAPFLNSQPTQLSQSCDTKPPIPRLERSASLQSSSIPSSQQTSATKPKLVKGVSWPKTKPSPARKEETASSESSLVIANVKQAHECQEFGEQQKFIDEIKYTLSNLNKTRSIMIRCLSCCNLAAHCLKAEFRQQLRARCLTGKVLLALRDAPGHQTLALGTAMLVLVLTKDQVNADLDRSSLELVTKLLSMDELTEEPTGKAYKDHCRIVSKVKSIYSKLMAGQPSDQGANGITDDPSVTHLILCSLLNLMNTRDGQLCKEQLRLVGTLDHVASLVVNNFKLLRQSPAKAMTRPAVDPLAILTRMLQPLTVLEAASYLSKSNQSYLVVYDGSTLVTTLTRVLQYCQDQVMASAGSETVTQALLAALKLMVNITHDNELGSQRVGEQQGIIENVCHSILVLPTCLNGEERFDVLVMSLGLLINLVEFVSPNRETLQELMVEVAGRNAKALSHLIDMFLLHYTTAEQADISLPTPKSVTAGSSTKNSISNGVEMAVTSQSAASGSSDVEQLGLGWLEGDEVLLEDPLGSSPGQVARSRDQGLSSSSSDDGAGNSLVISREELNTAILQAGKQMEHSFVAAYCGLVLGVMCRYSESSREFISTSMPSRSFKEMIGVLQKFVNFSDMVNSVSQSGMESVRKIILYLKEFDK